MVTGSGMATGPGGMIDHKPFHSPQPRHRRWQSLEQRILWLVVALVLVPALVRSWLQPPVVIVVNP